MREILFRGKSPDNGEWVYGVPVIAKDDIADKDIIVMVDNPNEIVPMEGLALFEQVDPETVGQYTGLTDKNGKKIFEGDIVKETIASNYQPIGQIYYAPEFCQWRIEYINSIVLIGHIGKGRSYTILGNIHDNPELLEGK